MFAGRAVGAACPHVLAKPHNNPWYVIPADQKFYARYLVSEALLEALQACDPAHPKLSEAELQGLQAYRERLEKEQ